jgi:hypothetical protein
VERGEAVNEIKRGDHVVAIDAIGTPLPKRALSGVERGASFPIVWVSRPDEWDAAEREGREPEGVPWPADDVKIAATEDISA